MVRSRSPQSSPFFLTDSFLSADLGADLLQIFKVPADHHLSKDVLAKPPGLTLARMKVPLANKLSAYTTSELTLLAERYGHEKPLLDKQDRPKEHLLRGVGHSTPQSEGVLHEHKPDATGARGA